jgi:hypothetical protein
MRSVLAGAGWMAVAELPPAAEDEVDFMRDVFPILRDRCVSCHEPDNIKSGLRMDTREMILKGGIEGPAAVVGNSAESLMIKLIAGTEPDFDQMPPDEEALSDEQIGLLRAWIDQGMEWPEGVVIDAPEYVPVAAPHAVEAPVAGLPDTWRVQATRQEGPLAEWALPTDIRGPEDQQAIVVRPPDEFHAETLNLLWTSQPQFHNGMFEVKVKALSGEEKQGGGLIWRVGDRENYYGLAHNPLTSKFALYKVVDGEAEEITGTEVELEEEQEWVTLRVEHSGAEIKAYLDGDLLLEAEDDSLEEAGGLGYWSAADAETAFAGTRIDLE